MLQEGLLCRTDLLEKRENLKKIFCRKRYSKKIKPYDIFPKENVLYKGKLFNQEKKFFRREGNLEKNIL